MKHPVYVQFDGMLYQQVVGIPLVTNCTPLIAGLFLYCYEGYFMANLQKSKRFDLIGKVNDTSRYLDDISYSPSIILNLLSIFPTLFYPRELRLNKANISDKETSFLDLNI